MYFKYKRYHKDPHPLALILYADDKIVHCLNLHYLQNNVTQQVLNMIAMIITRQLTRNTYKLYHSYMKRYMPHVIHASYRTYKPQYIIYPTVVSNGFAQSMSFLMRFVPRDNKKIIQKKIVHNIHTQLQTTKNVSPKKLQSHKQLSTQTIIQQVDNYMRKIQNILNTTNTPQKLHKKLDAYTFLTNKKPKQ